jgi:membrane-bound lytic murein transglycosylase B
MRALSGPTQDAEATAQDEAALRATVDGPAAAVATASDPGPAGWPDATVASLARRPGFAVLRNTVRKACVDALQANFPAVTRLVGDEWMRAAAARFAVEPPSDPEARAALLAPDIVPTFSAAEMIERGARLPDEALAVESLLALVELQNGDEAPSYVAGTSNFYTLTRYNWSSYYAMAVLELGEAVRAMLR